MTKEELKALADEALKLEQRYTSAAVSFNYADTQTTRERQQVQELGKEAREHRDVCSTAHVNALDDEQKAKLVRVLADVTVALGHHLDVKRRMNHAAYRASVSTLAGLGVDLTTGERP